MENKLSGHALAEALRSGLCEIVIGKKKEITLLLCALLSGGHVLIEDIPGVGKTTLASALARLSGLSYNRVQFTPDVTASDIAGCSIYNRRDERFDFRPGAVMCNLLLGDEINRASPKTQSALLEAMSENSVTVDGVNHPLPSPFMVIATQNPLGFVGTYPLPEAQLDRFALRISLGYPSREAEIRLAAGHSHDFTLPAITPIADSDAVCALKAETAAVNIEKEVYEYIVDLVSATRNDRALTLGASPRASITLARLAKAYAYLDGRDYVLPTDVSALFGCALSHRVVLSQESKKALLTPEQVLERICGGIAVPSRAKSTRI